METKLLFQQDADVLTADGRQVGRIERVVLNPETRVITHIVVQTGSLFNKEQKVVPIEDVTETTEKEIALREDSREFDSLPPLEEKHYIPPGEDVARATPAAGQPSIAYGTPMMGALADPAPSGEGFVTHIDQNIPEGTVAMKEGARVMSAEGKHVGNVERVMAEAPADEATYLLVSSGLLSKEHKLIPIQWVMMVSEDEVHLRVKQATLEELAHIT